MFTCIGCNIIVLYSIFSKHYQWVIFTNMVKVVVADNHVLFRMGLVAFLRQEPRIEIAGEYKSFSSLQPLIPKLNNHLLVIDISLNKEFGRDVANYIKETNSTIKVI